MSTTSHSLSVIIPTHDTRELTLGCLTALEAATSEAVEIVVVDDASSDGTREAIRRTHPHVRVLRSEVNVGFSAAANLGADAAGGEVVLFLNSDTEVRPGAVEALVAVFGDDPAVGVAGAQLLDPDGTPQWSAGPHPTPAWLFLVASGLGALLGRLRPRKEPRAVPFRVSWVTGAAMAVRRKTWNAVGPFAEAYRFYAQDLDLCRAAADAGWKVVVVPSAKVVHHHGATISRRRGATAGAHPALLWTDLLRHVARLDGARAAGRARAALVWGAWLRVTARRLAGWQLRGPRGELWRAQTSAYADGLAALRRSSDDAASS
jgi:GT2 family glycosyltransferase